MPALYQTVNSGIDPWAVQKRISTSDARYALASTLMPVTGSSMIEYRSGVMAAGDGGNTHLAGKVSPVSAMTVRVNPANVVVNTSGSGPYMGAIAEAVNLTLKPASSTANRIDAVIVRIYDDLNPAIGSTPDQRKLAVEVWSGDDTTGTPARPTLPISAGWHPLAYITVNANTATITSAMIQDARGPGLVTRGGMRALYGADAAVTSSEFQSAGAYPGDQRWVHGTTFPHQVYYGSGVGWRGVQNGLNYRGYSQYTGSGLQWFKSYGVHATIAQVTVPDPGSPYMIYPSARIEAWYGRGVRADYYISATTDTGQRMTWASGDMRWNQGGDMHLITNIAPMMFGPFTGSRTITLHGAVWDQLAGTGYGWGLDRALPNNTELNVMIYPSTVPPSV